MQLDYEDLFKPYTADGHTLENTIVYLRKVAKQYNIGMEVFELVMTEVFMELSEGKVFNKQKCSCGCGIDKSATDLIHSIRDRMIELNDTIKANTLQILQKRHNASIASYTKLQNEQYIKQKMAKYSPKKEALLSQYYKFMNLKRSPTLKLFKRSK